MTRPPKATPPAAPASATAPEGERIAKVLSRAGIASRREAERMIEAGEVTVNGKVIDSPALNVGPRDRITVNGQPLAAPEPARLWLYYKPEGLVTSNADEKGRDTIFDHLPEDLPRVMSVGRLDLNSEGLLLLTNDGELKRRLELPSTGWLRKYRVRVKGNPTDPDLEPLRRGITVEGEDFQPMQVILDRHQGANAWLTVGLREGKNREIRRAMFAIGLTVNRLIRISYGPFRLNELKPGEVEEVRPKVLRDQLGLTGEASDGDTPRQPGRPARPETRPNKSAPRGAHGPAPAASERSGPRTSPKPGVKTTARSGARPTTKSDAKPAVPRGATLLDAPAPRRGGKPFTKPAGGPTGKPSPSPRPTGAKPAPKSGPKTGPRPPQPPRRPR
ncbi:MAG: pseudouridine synthase [Fuscovulum sp.]|nr:MAG: pseudouridine synthase [Fuscovulum sp.]